MSDREAIVVAGRECRFVHNRSGDAERHYDHGWYITDGEGRFMRRFADGSYEWSWGYCGDEGHWPTEAAAREFALSHSQPGKGDADGWRTIDSAPKDGTRFIAYWPYWSHEPFVAYYCGESGAWEGDRCVSPVHAGTFPERQPTHWMKLPAAPAGG